MSWEDRLRGTIEFTSPDNKTFSALWADDSRGNQKSIGFFKYPKVKGVLGQDLDVGGDRYIMTIFFDGPDNDLVAQRFYISCAARGKWNVIHPVHGSLDLQLLTYKQNVTPVNAGNVTSFDLEFVDTIDPSVLVSPVELGSLINSSATDLNSISASQYSDNLRTDTASELLANRTAVEKTVVASDSAFSSISSQNASISSQITSIKRGITDTLDADSLDSLSLAGQIQQLIQLPLLAITDVRARTNAYKTFAANILGTNPSGNTPEDFNSVMANELALMAALSGMGLSVLGTLGTRSQVIEIVDDFSNLFLDITYGLDEVQTNFETLDIDDQYFSQSSSFNDAVDLTSQSLKYLLIASFDLAIEKRFELIKDRCPVEIVITEYGDLGEDEINLDQFIESNKLKADDIRILRAGREVVVYV